MKINYKVLISIVLFTYASISFASTFKLNYKNINTLANLICSVSSESKLKHNQESLNTINIKQITSGPKKSDRSFEVSGSCNIIYNLDKKRITNFGEEIDFTLSINNKEHVTGSIGIKQIHLKNSMKDIHIKDTLFGESFRVNLSDPNWAHNNSIFSFNNKNKILIKGRSIAATEMNNKVEIKSKIKRIFSYKIWSSNSYSCSNLNSAECSKILNKM